MIELTFASASVTGEQGVGSIAARQGDTIPPDFIRINV
jgi:hypothetical protein